MNKKKIKKIVKNKHNLVGIFLVVFIVLFLVVQFMRGFKTGSSYKGDLGTYVFFGEYFLLFVFGLILAVCWKIRKSKYFNILRVLLFLVSSFLATFTIIASLLDNHYIISFLGVVFLVLSYILTRKDWYPYVLLLLGLSFLPVTLMVLLLFVAIPVFNPTLRALIVVSISVSYPVLLFVLGYVELRRRKKKK